MSVRVFYVALRVGSKRFHQSIPMLPSVQVHPSKESSDPPPSEKLLNVITSCHRHGPFVGGDYSKGIIQEVRRDNWVESVCFSPNGEHVAVGGWDKTLAIISTLTWRIIQEVKREGVVFSISFSPNGEYLVVGGGGGKVTVISASTWGIIKEVERERDVYSVNFSPRGEYLAVGGMDGKVVILSTLTWGIIKEVTMERIVKSVCFSPNGEHLAIGGGEGKVDIFSTLTWGIVQEVKREGEIACVCFSPSGDYMAVGGKDKRVAIISTSIWGIVYEVIREGEVESVVYSPSGEHLAVGGWDGKVAIVSTFTWEIIQEVSRGERMYSVCFSPNGEHVAVGGWDKYIAIVNTSTWRIVEEVKREGLVWSVSVSFSGEHVAMGGVNKKVTVISTLTWNIVEEFKMEGDVKSVCFSPNGEYLVVGGGGGKVTVISASTWGIFKEVERERDVYSVNFSPRGEHLAVGGMDKSIAIFCTSTWNIAHNVKIEGEIQCVCFGPSGEYLAVGRMDGKVAILSTLTWGIVKEVEREGLVFSLCFSPNGKHLAVGGIDRKVAILSTLTWGIVKEIEREGLVFSLCFSPNGEHLAVGGMDGKVGILSTWTWGIVLEVKKEGDVYSVCFSPSGEHLAAGGNDKKVLFVQLGPRLSVEFASMEMVERSLADRNSTIRIPSYCFEYATVPTLIERCLVKGTPIEAISYFVFRNPKLLCATTIKKECTAAQVFADALMKNGQAGLIQTVLTTLFSREVFSQLMFTPASTCLEEHFGSIISSYSDVWIKVLKETCLVPWPYLTTHKSKSAEWKHLQHPSDSLTKCPWGNKVHVTGGDILVTVFPISRLFSFDILKLMITHCDMSSVDNDAMGHVLKILWKRHVMKYFYAEFIVYCVCVIFWAKFLEEDRRIGVSTLQLVCMLVVGLIVVLLIGKEVFAAIRGATFTSTKEAENEISTSINALQSVVMSVLKPHFSDGWNVVDAFALGLTLICLGIACTPSHNSRGVSILHVVNSALLTIKFLAYLRGFEGTGWLITVLLQNVKDMRGFMVILIVILAGFTVIFRTLFDTVEGHCEAILSHTDDDGDVSGFAVSSDCSRGPFEKFALVAFGVFNMGIMGDFDTDNFDDSVSPWTSRVCFVLLVVVVTVIALNALIALLGDSYSQIQENMVANRNFERAKVIVEYMSLFSESDRDRLEKEVRYLFVLVPKHDLDSDGHINRRYGNEWEGSINATKKLFETKFKLSEIKLQSEMADVKSDLKSLNTLLTHMKSDVKSDLNTELTQLKSEITELKSDLKSVLSLLSSGPHQISQLQLPSPGLQRSGHILPDAMETSSVPIPATIIRRRRIITLPRRRKRYLIPERGKPHRDDADIDNPTRAEAIR